MFKVKDYYYKKAKSENYLARSIYKLEEIDKKFSLIKPGNLVLDLGYFPGSWTQYCLEKVGKNGHVYGIDIQPVNKKLENISHLSLFEKDIFSLQNLDEIGMTSRADVVLSDMAPSTTGIKSVDQDRSLNLVETVFEHLPVFLRPGGHFVIKIFDSQQAQNYLKLQKKTFESMQFLKPKSTRSVSKEFFVIGKGFRA